MAEQIIVAGQRGAELTQCLLAFGRKQMLRPRETDCNALVDSMRASLGRTLRKDIAIAAQLDPALAPAYADPAQIELAILNLSLNAQDAMPRGGSLTITTGNVTLDERYRLLNSDLPSGDYVMIAVTDDGDGMPPTVCARAFEPFFTTKDVGKGSGLGLSTVYGFVKQSNGHVALYSQPGLGTTVRLYLPTSAAGRANGGATPTAEDAAIPRGTGTVLVVEDDPCVRAYVVSSLENLGYSVIAAIDGQEGEARLAQPGHIDMLFSDIVMPGGMSGKELAQLAKRVRPGIKVLLTSGYAFETLAARGHLDPAFGVLNKPYRRADLARRIREVMEGQ